MTSTVLPISATPVHVGHDVTLARHRHESTKETVTLLYATEWRGEGATVRMVASRYSTADGTITPWSIYAEKANAVDDTYPDGTVKVRGRSLTDTARTRLADAHKAAVAAYLASIDYTASYRVALAYELKGWIRESRPYGEPPTREVRAAIDAHADVLTAEAIGRLTDACDAFDAWALALDAVIG